MDFAHFLARVTDDNWKGFVGQYNVVLNFGPVSFEAIRVALRTLRERPEWQSIDLALGELTDCSAQLVPISDGLMSGAVEQLTEQLTEVDEPLLVPDAALKEVLLLTDEYDETQVGRLTVYGESSTLAVSVRLPEVLRGRLFPVHGALPLVDLPGAFRGVPA